MQITFFRCILINVAVVLVAVFGTETTFAKSHYVEKWGSDSQACGSKADPCQSIGQAIANAGRNDRIVVGPGRYVENDLTIDQNGMGEALEGLKLESVAGRYATTIKSSLPQDDALEVRQPRVAIGRKGRGFTFMGGTDIGNAGLYMTSPERCKVEGNRFGVIDETETNSHNYAGLYIVSGDSCQVRNNVFRGNSRYGFYCISCDRLIVRDNRLEGNGGDAMYISGADHVVLQRNLVVENPGNGLTLDALSEYSRIQDSVFADNGNSSAVSGTGLTVGNGGGGRFQGNILSNNYIDGMVVGQGLAISTKIQKNLASENGDDGFRVRGVGVRIDANTAIGNGDDGFDFPTVLTLSSFRNGNAWSNDGCDIDNADAANTVKYTKLFKPDDFLCGPGSYDLNSSESEKQNPIRVNRARGL
jgi:hypothetical protein